MAFIGKGSSAIKKRLFRAVRAKLYYYQTGYRGLYKLGCRGSLPLVKGEGEASRACVGGACADGAYVGRAYANRACADKACVDKAYVDRVYTDRVCVGEACIDGAACQGVGVISG